MCSNDTFLGHILQLCFHAFLPSSFGALKKYCQELDDPDPLEEGLGTRLLYDINYTGDIDTPLGQ